MTLSLTFLTNQVVSRNVDSLVSTKQVMKGSVNSHLTTLTTNHVQQLVVSTTEESSTTPNARRSKQVTKKYLTAIIIHQGLRKKLLKSEMSDLKVL